MRFCLDRRVAVGATSSLAVFEHAVAGTGIPGRREGDQWLAR